MRSDELCYCDACLMETVKFTMGLINSIPTLKWVRAGPLMPS